MKKQAVNKQFTACLEEKGWHEDSIESREQSWAMRRA